MHPPPKEKKPARQKRGIGSLVGILRYILQYRLFVTVILACAIIGNLLALVVPRLTGDMVDALAAMPWGAGILARLAQGALHIILVSLASWGLSVLRDMLMLHTAQNVVRRLRYDVFAKLMKLPVSYFDNRSKGDIISVVSVDIENVSDTISSDAVTLISGFITVVGALLMMLTISPKLTLIFVFTVPLMAVTARIISKRARLLHRLRKDCFGRLCGYSEEMITAQNTIKSYGIEEYNLDNFKEIAAELREKGSKAEFQSSCMMPVMNGINNLNFTLICLFGALMALGGGISIGNISAFILYSKRFAHPIVDTANIINMFQTSLAACDRVFAILNAQTEPDAALPESSGQSRREGKITLEDVSFSYDKPGTPVLSGLELEIQPGQCIAVVGATGSGKTTLISLLLRFYDVSSGRILLDGVDIRDIPLRELRRCFALVLQDSWLFEGSVYENIAYAAPPRLAGHDAIERICGEILVDEFIRTLPEGYDTVLHNDSGGLSQGQRQLVNIARAFLCDPPIFILDEATSSVDTMIEAQIKKVTERVIKGKTSIIIAHRLSTILRADKILVVKDGVFCESGTHSELLAMGGEYKNLYESQFAALRAGS
ncbi:MAG: ABC transporter ATP-binding protein/permease [Oscillospiraceae bacterium]|nr:ABC transporter ATP-binding protein/permease [Oscillospiraceae bacterium]